MNSALAAAAAAGVAGAAGSHRGDDQGKDDGARDSGARDRRARARDPVFENSTESGSRSIAERFAPSAGSPIANGPKPPPAAPVAPRKPGLLNSLNFLRSPTTYKRPSLNLLMRPSAPRTQQDTGAGALRAVAGRLEQALADFGIEAQVLDFHAGPVLTTFLVEPAQGTKTSRIIALADDVARAMGAPTLRVSERPRYSSTGHNQAAQPAMIAIELPNQRPDVILLRDLLDHEIYRTTEAALPMAIGKGAGGDPVIIDLATLPHLLVAGAPNSGKSTALHAMILSLLFQHAPDDCRLLLIDPNMVELGPYNAIPHLIAPVIADAPRGIALLQWAVAEMEERMKRMALIGLQDVNIFNNRVRNARRRGERLARTVQIGFDQRTGLPIFEDNPLDMEVMAAIVVVVDEFADLMLLNRRATETAVQRLAAEGRAVGIHLIIATERPSQDVVTPALLNAFPVRLIFRMASRTDSRTVLGESGAERLLGHSDMLVTTGSAPPMRAHGAMVSAEDVESVAASLRAQGSPRYIDGVGDLLSGEGSGASASGQSSHAQWSQAG